MLMLEFSGYNLVLDTSGGQAVLRRASSGDAYLVVGFPPQAVLEAAVPVGDTPPVTWPSPPLPALLAGASQLAFSVPPAVQAIPFTLDALLDWAALPLLVEVSPLEVSGAQPPDLATYIEAPALLFLSPDSSATWSHSPAPVTYSAAPSFGRPASGSGVWSRPRPALPSGRCGRPATPAVPRTRSSRPTWRPFLASTVST
jgi:hypothetical protein